MSITEDALPGMYMGYTDNNAEQWIRALKNGNPTVRSQATYILRKFEDPEVIPALIEALGDKDFAVRRNAAKTLGYKKAAAAVHELKKLTNDRDPYLKKTALQAIRKIESA